jgi:7,8-dihydropterin-6-yl-methyl-4-(beta-D-ribofuranosyl)aminobenzene 5'-phosphate synthase
MMQKMMLFIYLAISLTNLLSAQNDKLTLSQIEIDEMNEALQADSDLSKLFSRFGEPVQLYKDYKKNLLIADSIWTHDQESLNFFEIGETEKFEMIPLVDWFTDNDSLIGESGVSYLIKTDDATILFDLGLNINETHPSPLLNNMNKLGISIDDIDMIVISHNHNDHVGGAKWNKANSFSFTNYQLELKQIPVYTPIEMNYPGLAPTCTPKPTKISKGVATTGLIYNPVFVFAIAEQALAINVKNKGIVIISGCGHQSISKLVERTDILFKEPLYGVLGGFHLPIEENRNITTNYKYIVVDKLPWERLTLDDVNNDVALLKAKGVSLIGISGHDSCNKSISAFKKEFGESYVDIKVGKKIVLNE